MIICLISNDEIKSTVLFSDFFCLLLQKQRKMAMGNMEHSFPVLEAEIKESMPFRQSPSDIFSSTEDLSN